MKYSTLVELACWRASEQAEQNIYTFLHAGQNAPQVLSYQKLDRRARGIGALLQQHGAFGERVLLLYPPGLEFITAFLGCLYAGAIAVPAYPPRNKRHLPRIQTIVEDAQATLLLTVKNTKDRVAAWLEQDSPLTSLKLIDTDDFPEESASSWQPCAMKSSDLAFLQYTSGSTASPKGVMVSHENLMCNLTLIQQSFEHTPESIGVSWLPPYHDMGLIGGILQPLFVGFPIVLMSPMSFLQQPFRWLEAISTYRATTSGGPNFAYDLCVKKISSEQRQQLDLSSWDLAFNGAEPIHPDVLDNFVSVFEPRGFRKKAFYPCYGLAESTLFVTGGKKGEAPVIRRFRGKALEDHLVHEADTHDMDARELVGCGRELSGHTLRIVCPETLTPCPPHRVGEIWLTGPSVAQGYWEQPEHTAESFQAYLKDTGEGPFLRSGDLGFMKNGELFVTGRRKDLMIIRGKNHYPQDIEQTVELSYSSLRWNSSAAFSVSVGGEEQVVVVAEVERRYRNRRQQVNSKDRPEEEQRHEPERRQTSEAYSSSFNGEVAYQFHADRAIAAIRQAIAEHHGLNVHAVLLLKYGTIPKTSSGKIQRHACKTGFIKGSLDVVGEWREESDVLSPLYREGSSSQELFSRWESFIGDLWADILGCPRDTIHGHSHFFQFGGDSLQAILCARSISDAIGAELDFDVLYEFPVLKDVAAHLEEMYEVPPLLQVRDGLLAKYRKYCRPADTYFPLLPLQKLCFVLRACDESKLYMFLDAELHGTLDVAVFREASRILTTRHPALRLGVSLTFDRLRQTVLPLPLIHDAVAYHDLRQEGPEQLLVRIETETEALLQHHFRNDVGDTFRARLLTLDSQTHRLLMNVNCMALDGVSVAEWFEELQLVYSELIRGNTVDDRPQTTLSFKEYVEIYTARQRCEHRSRDAAYWSQHFSHHEPFPSLPECRDACEPNRFETYTSEFDSALMTHVRERARTLNVTFFSVLFAAFVKGLALWTNSNCLSVNTRHVNRRPYAHDVQNILGCFTDILPIQLDNLLTARIEDLARAVQQDLRNMHRYSAVSGVEIIEKYQSPLSLMSPVIFSSAMFPRSKENSEDAFALASLQIRLSAPATWLDVLVYDVNESFACSWNFRRKRFSRETIIDLASRYQGLLEEFAGDEADRDHVDLQAPPRSILHVLENAAEEERYGILVAYLRTQTAATFALPAGGIDVRKPLTGMGLDSLRAVELKNHIMTELNVDLPLEDFFEGKSLEELAQSALEHMTLARLVLSEAPTEELSDDMEEFSL